MKNVLPLSNKKDWVIAHQRLIKPTPYKVNKYLKE